MKQIWENRTIILLNLLFASCSVAKPIPNIDKVVVYAKFAPAGSTNDIKNDFHHQSTFNDSTTSKSIKVDEKDFTLALSNAKSKRHFQRKIPGITFAGKFYQGDIAHYFIYLNDSKVIIDLTDMRNYFLKDTVKYFSLIGQKKG